MTGRKIYFIVIIAIIGIFVLFGASKWREKHIIKKEMELNRLYTTPVEEMLKEESSTRASANNGKTQPANTPATPGKGKKP